MDSKYLLLALLAAGAWAAEPAPVVRPKEGETLDLQLKEGRGFLRVRFVKPSGAAAPEVTVGAIVESLTGRQLDGGTYLATEWDPKNNDSLTELDLKITTTGTSAVPLIRGTTQLQYRLGAILHVLKLNLVTRQPIGSRLTRQGSEAIQINASGGMGETYILFNRAAGVPPPKIELVPPQDSGVALPAEAFETTWDKTGRAWNESEAVTLRLAIKKGATLPPFSSAAGSVILRWPEGEQPYLAFKVVDTSQPTFTLNPTTVSVFSHVFQPNLVRVYVENTGVRPIHELRFSFTPLVDAENKREVQPAVYKATDAGLRRFQGHTFEVPIPDVDYAGIYQGSVKVSADGSQNQSVPITLRSRGPWGRYGLPFYLFVATLWIGYRISRRLAEWIDLGGAQRNQALLAMHDLRRDMERISNQLRENLNLLPRTSLLIDFTLQEIVQSIAEAERRTQQELDIVRQKAAKLTTALPQLVRAVTHIAVHRPETRSSSLPQLDALNPSEDDYAAKLMKVITDLPAPIVTEGALSGMEHPAPPPFTLEAGPQSRDELQAQRNKMERLVKYATYFSVFATAYMSVYSADSDYGTAIDYLQTILYGLGLSTAGAGILTKARSSFKTG